MESIYIEEALYDSKNECPRTDTFFLPISEVYNGTISLRKKESCPAPAPCCVTLRGPPLDSETGWTGELWLNTNLLN